MHLCVYASEVAAAVGKNPYQPPFSILMNVFKRYHQGSEFEQARRRLAETHGIAAEQIDTRDALIERGLSQSAELSEQVEALKAKVLAKKQSLTSVLQEAQTVVKDGVKQAKKKTREECKQDTVLGVVLGLQAADKPTQSISESDVIEHVSSQLKCLHGQTAEKTSVARLGVRENNCKFRLRELHKSATLSLHVGGRIDGLRDDRLVEIKNRKARFMTPLPSYDVIQVHCYMFLMDQEECDVIEHLPSGQEKITTVQWNQKLWEQTHKALVSFGRVFAALLARPEWQMRALQSATPYDQSLLYSEFLHHVTQQVG